MIKLYYPIIYDENAEKPISKRWRTPLCNGEPELCFDILINQNTLTYNYLINNTDDLLLINPDELIHLFPNKQKHNHLAFLHKLMSK